MAQFNADNENDTTSNEISASTKEFLNFEKTCEAYKDSDEEIKSIFNEINKLAGNKSGDLISEDMDDVELILKRAEDIAQETDGLLKCRQTDNILGDNKTKEIPQIHVTKADSEPKEAIQHTNQLNLKNNITPKHNGTPKRKPKARPSSASVIDSKKKEAAKVARFVTNSPKRMTCKHENLVEELKDTNERVKSLEIMNVQLNDDNKCLRKNLNEVNEKKQVAELKLVECEKFLNRLSKEYENRNMEMKSVKENENKMLAELNKERNDRKNLKLLHDKDIVVIQDLQRQCKEMEMILKRKHPDSVSALIVASKSSTVDDNKKKLLEERITRLEQELRDKEDHFQSILLTLQEKFGDMKIKYENHIIDVERQLMDDRKVNSELKNKLNKANLVDACVQTVPSMKHNIATQTFIRPSERATSAASRLSQNSTLLLNKLKEDSYLVATIKGLQSELTGKQRTIAKINRETEELRKNLRNLQKEKEVLLHINPNKRSLVKHTKSAENILARVNTEMEAELVEARKQRETIQLERNSLLDSLKRTNEEFIHLKKKRIQDLHTLQVAHEKELMQMSMQVYPLQEEIKLLNRTIEILQERVRVAEQSTRYQANMRDGEVHAGGDGFNNATKSSFRR